MQKNICDFLDSKQSEMQKQLLKLISINSALGETTATDPFGKEVSAALNQVVAIGSQLGLTSKNQSNYYATLDLGEVTTPNTALGILCHADIVPFGDGWDYSPQGQIAGNRLYGRGALDDKGPIIATIYALAALKSCGFQPQKPIRLVVGGNEENHSYCLEKYKEIDIPLWGGFSPDSDFPLVYAEKGIAPFQSSCNFQPNPTPAESPYMLLQQLDCGTVVNAVPGKAVAILEAVGFDNQLIEISQNRKIGVETLPNHQFKITAIGKAAHGSTPWEGESATKTLVQLLLKLPLQKEILSWLTSIYELFLTDNTGEAAGIAAIDETLGNLTINLGVLQLDKQQGSFKLDLRYPSTANWQKILEKITAVATSKKLIIENIENKKPLYVPEDSPLVQKLLKLYQTEVDETAKPLAIGGGTYCRMLPNFVSFGPIGKTTENTIHQANEYITKEHLLFLAKIYAQAIYLLSQN